MATNHGPFEAPQMVNPQELFDSANQSREGRFSIVVRSPDNQGAIVAKYEQASPFFVPANVGKFIVLTISDAAKMSDGSYQLDQQATYQSTPNADL